MGIFFGEATFVQTSTESNLRVGMAANEVNYLKSTICSETIENGIPDHQVPSKRQREIFKLLLRSRCLEKYHPVKFPKEKSRRVAIKAAPSVYSFEFLVV